MEICCFMVFISFLEEEAVGKNEMMKSWWGGYNSLLLPPTPSLDSPISPLITCIVIANRWKLRSAALRCLLGVKQCQSSPSAKKKRDRRKTSTAGVHQMPPFCRHLFIIIIIIVVVVIVGYLKSFQPQKQRFSSFENNTGPSDGRTDGRTDGLTDTTSHSRI